MPPTTSSDSEDDHDYIPPAEDVDSSSESDEAERPVKEGPKEDLVDKKNREREALWASFQASVSTPTPPREEGPAKKLVKIEKKYLFAGKHVVDVVEVPEDSEDAKKWPLWRPEGAQLPSSEEQVPEAAQLNTEASSSSAAPTIEASKPAGRRPGPRKLRASLPSLPKAGSSQAKKITTLDKSAMDWRAHLHSQPGDVKDELNANRRGGGYLEKVEFLQRVGDRREDALEASKSNKRRKI
ncbi:hypothetical protein HYDPIDRAFT_176221 [Hydnomerulius pinastri MD-312]|uniref:SWR1-complex protein 5 n=1 Tax=Hydnomerulius pinastri MD-312 TaxID=994086 RepID=A0A0C9VC79_9AGAM|nr:hypothetical protein HYDPIDRAFT_176221 [Hydnomerulius pinastri MD-312]